jgi:hypothetical protein
MRGDTKGVESKPVLIFLNEEERLNLVVGLILSSQLIDWLKASFCLSLSLST